MFTYFMFLGLIFSGNEFYMYASDQSFCFSPLCFWNEHEVRIFWEINLEKDMIFLS